MSDIERIEASIEHANARIKLATMARNLYDNNEFNKIIIEGYLKDEAVRLVGLYGSGNLAPEQLVEVSKDLHGIGSFKRYLRDLVRSGDEAESDLAAAKREREDMLAMEAMARAEGHELPQEVDPHYAGSLGA